MKNGAKTHGRSKNLRTMVLFMLIVMCSFSLTIAILILVGAVGDFLTYIYKDNLRTVASVVSQYNFNNTLYYYKMSDLESKHYCYIEIYNPEDELIYTTRDNAAMLESETPLESDIVMKPRIMRVLEHEDIWGDDDGFFEVRQEYYGISKYLVYGDVIKDGYSILVFTSLDSLEVETENLEKFIWICTILAITTVIAMLFTYNHSVIIPVIKIKYVTRSIARLDFSQKCPSSNVKDIRELGKNVDYLSQTLSQTLRELKEKNARLEYEINHERELEQIRRDFIANASHELKTPIAIIQGYAEGIKVGINDRESTEEYCDIIINESEKMNNLIIRMLEVSRLAAEMKVKAEVFDGGKHIREMMYSFTPLFADAGIEASLIGVPESFMCTGDVTLLDMVFGNYVSNAISYAKGEKKYITVDCEKRGDRYRISVFNSGSHIADEDIDKIWIGFYRADKAHSREKGHFGLGLSFVSTIQNLHSCEYGVYNQGNGVVFWFDVKAAE